MFVSTYFALKWVPIEIFTKNCFCKLAKNSFSWISRSVLTLEQNMSRQTIKCVKFSIYNASCTFCSKLSTNRDTHKKLFLANLQKQFFLWISRLVLTLEQNMSKQTINCIKFSINNMSRSFCSKVSLNRDIHQKLFLVTFLRPILPKRRNVSKNGIDYFL